MADAAYTRLAQRVARRGIVIYGESLGTAVAVVLGAQAPAAAHRRSALPRALVAAMRGSTVDFFGGAMAAQR